MKPSQLVFLEHKYALKVYFLCDYRIIFDSDKILN